MADQWAEPLFPCNSSKLSFAKPGFMKSFMKMMNSWENIRIGKTASKSAGKCKGVVASRLGQPNYFPNKLRMKKQQQNLMKKKQNFMKNINFQKMMRTKFVLSWCLVGERTFLHRVRRTAASFFSRSRTEHILMKFKKKCVFHQNSNFHECHFFSYELGGGVEKRRRPEKRVLEGKNSKNTRFRENGRVNK